MSICAYHITDPRRYGIVAFDTELRVLSIGEEPKRLCSNWNGTSLYLHASSVVVSWLAHPLPLARNRK